MNEPGSPKPEMPQVPGIPTPVSPPPFPLSDAQIPPYPTIQVKYDQPPPPPGQAPNFSRPETGRQFAPTQEAGLAATPSFQTEGNRFAVSLGTEEDRENQALKKQIQVGQTLQEQNTRMLEQQFAASTDSKEKDSRIINALKRSGLHQVPVIGGIIDLLERKYASLNPTLRPFENSQFSLPNQPVNPTQ